jgi:hypothetical protein
LIRAPEMTEINLHLDKYEDTCLKAPFRACSSFT